MTDKEKELQAEAIGYYRKRITELEKACEETQELLDKQIEATYRLDKENAELKKKLKEELKTIADKDLSFVARFDALEKENAELKSIADFQQSGNMSRYFELKRQAEKLEEAKELLKKLLVHSKRYIWIADDNNKPIMQKEIAEAEQFIKDSEVEK